MPAINRVRLEKQIAALQEHLAEPQHFVRQVCDLLAFYANPAYSAGQSGSPAPLLDTFHAPPQVVRTLIMRIVPWLQAQPAAGLTLLDALWDSAYLECRRTAAELLGKLPLDVQPAILARLDAWLQATPEMLFQAEIIQHALERLRQEAPLAYADWIEARLHARETQAHLNALQAIRAWVESDDFDNAPLVFRWLRALSDDLPSAMRSDFQAILMTLSKRVPQETAYFLNVLRQSHDTPQIRALVQRVRTTLPAAWRDAE